MPTLRCFTVARCQSGGIDGNPDCVHIVVRFTIAHIIGILLVCCTRWHGDGVWDYSTSVGLSYSLCRFGVSHHSCVVVWCLSFLDVHSVKF